MTVVAEMPLRQDGLPGSGWSPQAHANAVERTDVLRHVFEADARVVVFQGPAGHGKTSLMLQAKTECADRGFLSGWLTFNGSDNDLNRFLQHLHALVHELRVNAAVSSKATYEDEDGTITSTSDWVLSQLLELGCQVAIFMDDLHNVTGRATLTFLRDLISNAPNRIRWFLASRVVSEIGLPRLVVGDQALLVQSAELCFNRGELQRFFSRDCSPPLSNEELDVIFEATEGWPAAAQLYRLALRSPEIRRSLGTGRSHHLREMSGYLAENVLSQQEEHIQTFLVRTSILERMSPRQCDNLLGRNDSDRVLRDLERLGLFVRRLESNEDWFTYHPLFSKFLQERLFDAGEAEALQLHIKAAEWYRTHRFYEDALYHFLAASDYDNGCLAFDEWADALISEGFLATVDHWSSKIPLNQLAKHPNLVTKIAWALLFLTRLHKLEPLLPIIKAHLKDDSSGTDYAIVLCMASIIDEDLQGALKYLASVDPQAEIKSRFRALGLSAAYNARAYAAMATGNFDSAMELLSQGRSLSERSDATFTLAYSMAKIGIVYVSQGYLQEALIHFRSAMADSRMYMAESISKASLACAFIMALYEANDVNGALEQFNQHHQMIADAGLHDYVVVCYRAIARIHDLQGRPDEALKALDAGERRAFSCEWPGAVALMNWERVRRELLAGNLERARAIANRIPEGKDETKEDRWIRFSEESEDAVIGRVRLMIYDHRYPQALEIIQKELKVPSIGKRVLRKIRLHTLAALAWKRRGDDKQAHRSLYLAVELAAPGGYMRSVLDEGPELVQLAQKYLHMQADLPTTSLSKQAFNFLCRLIELAGLKAVGVNYLVLDTAAVTAGVELGKTLPQALTKKEKKILTMLIAYMSNEQIASALFVSRDTVKYHIKNIYGKLGAKNRLEAIRTAIALGLGG